ncbi:mechanosensitive ion channel family protein [Desulfohalovibrio reitneri]|uniref:mechanosensitive ion channel family protein n=1 Tax=Desulfohalovibrio reitneri TaxID=1307759 RepID=UPI0006906746|nr:mechanosensitive ion channel domain-containing protein [Desulfohalovibrio reitneri]
MDTFSPHLNKALAWLRQAGDWAAQRLLSAETATQAGVLLALLVLAFILAAPLRRTLQRRFDRLYRGVGLGPRLFRSLVRQTPYLAALALTWIAWAVNARLGGEETLFRLASSLLLAWLAIRFATAFVLSRFWARLIAGFVWALAALNILGLLAPAMALLDSVAFNLGEVRISLLTLSKATILVLVMLRAGSWLSNLAEHRLAAMTGLTPSARVLIGKLIKVVVITLVIMIALNSVGLDLTTLAVFSGAVGVGIGFGLQKVVANLISGFILLMDKSIKPGDVIEIGDVYGWITTLRARYASVVTRDGKEYLIPNEDLITTQVVNWSFSNRNIRLKLPVGVSYNSDIRLAMRIMADAAKVSDRVLTDPPPLPRLVGFGDSSVDLELRFWIADPQNGIVNVKSDIYLAVWDGFKEHGIEIPFPQRDVHVRSGLEGLSGKRDGSGGEN